MIKINAKKWIELADEVIDKIGEKEYTGVFGVPRGGVPLAVYVSTKTGLELLDSPKIGCLVVDDLIDSGTTRNKYSEYDFEVQINKQKMDEQEWIEFFYEDTPCDDKDLVTRLAERLGVKL